MKRVNIALLVMAGALAGALVMRLMQRPARVAMRRPARAAMAAGAPQPAARPGSDLTPPALAKTASAERAYVPQADSRLPETPRPFNEPGPAKRPAPRAKPATHRIAPPVTFAEGARAMRPARRPIEAQAQPASDAPRLSVGAAAPAAPTQQSPAAPPATPEQPNETPPARMEPENVTPVSAPSAPQPNQATLNAGMLIPVRLLDGLSSDRNHAGDLFAATLDRELVASGFVVAERGARVGGRVVAADPNTRTLTIEIVSVHTSDNQDISIQTERFDKRSEPDRSNSALKIGGGAAVGAVIGGIAGGGKGAAIGAAAGGGIGAGDVMLTRKGASLASETRVTFRLRAPVTITERAQ